MEPVIADFPLKVEVESTYATSMPSYLSPIASVLDRFHGWREQLNLPDPGKGEDLGREVKSQSPSPAPLPSPLS